MVLKAISRIAAVSSLVIGFAGSPAIAAPRYIAVPLEPANGLSSTAKAINALGDVAGNVYPNGNGGETRAFRYVGGTMQDLGTLGGPASDATGISDDGQVAGWSWTAERDMRAFLYSSNSMRDLGALLVGQQSNAWGISADGQVTGWSSHYGVDMHAFRYASGAMQDLGVLSRTESVGSGINQAGDVTGWSALADGSMGAFIYSGGVMRALGTFRGGSSIGRAINALGQVTGDGGADLNEDLGLEHAFLYTDGKMLDLGTLGGPESFGFAINVRGDVVGSSDVDKKYSSAAFLYTDGSMYNLNSLVVSGLEEYTLYEARGINDRGQIAATGSSSGPDGRALAFRLDPVTPDPPNAAIEYHHATFDHYFLTANPAEIAAMDSGQFSGWSRTGQLFSVHLDASAGTNAVCRFFGAAFTSHFYTANADECALVKTYPAWQFEGIAFNIAVPDPNGNCPSATQPVYRLYNNGKGAAPNHRFTTSLATRSQMVDAGWVTEGSGPLGVAMCAPQ
jgi:probable HAF family extracellular repeat protein